MRHGSVTVYYGMPLQIATKTTQQKVIFTMAGWSRWAIRETSNTRAFSEVKMPVFSRQVRRGVGDEDNSFQSDNWVA